MTLTIRKWVAALLVAGLWMAASQPVSAVIGDTVEDLFKRYGAGKEIGGQMLYKIDLYSASIYFNASKSSMEVYSRLPGLDGVHAELSDVDVQNLLRMQGGNAKWNVVITKRGEKTWSRQDGKVIARYKPQDKALVFVDAALK